MEPLVVTRAEAGQKLLAFLERRVENPQSDLHKWIRTGQVRRNGGRVRPFDRLDEGDAVRVPPFAELRGQGNACQRALDGFARACGDPPGFVGSSGLGLPVVFENEDLLVLNKPAGLPSQGGTGHTDSVAARLTRCFMGADFVPAPAHRLDKDTSGLLLAGKTYAALRSLTDAMAGRAEAPRKEYLAWVWGDWPQQGECELRDRLTKDEQGRRMRAMPDSPVATDTEEGKEARCLVLPLENRNVSGLHATLLLVRLLTGRTHQIRVQLASRGYPVAGDLRYGKPGDESGLKLHSCRIILPSSFSLPKEAFTCFPAWTAPWQVRAAGFSSFGA